jgi:hypothetical protein
MAAELLPNGLWELVEPFTPAAKQVRRAGDHAWQIERVSWVFSSPCESDALGKCCRKNWVWLGHDLLAAVA